MRSLYKPSAVAAALAVILFLAVNVIFQETLRGARIDLTEDRLYTISENTEELLEGLEEPVELTYFFSEDVAREFPQFFSYGRRIRDVLREYSAIAGDNLRLEVVKPEPFSEAEDRAVAAGLQGVPTGGGEQIYMGLVARDLTDREEMIPFFNQEREALLEYDITKLIWSVARTNRPKLTLLTSLPMTPQAPSGRMPMQQQQGADGWAIYEQLNELFDVREIQPGFNEIPEDTDVLLIAHPPELGAEQLYAIDQYVMAGGRAAVFVDPYSEASASPRAARQGQPGGGGPESSDLEPLLSAWGVRLSDGKVVADAGIAQRVNMGGGGPRAIQDFILWLAARQDTVDTNDPVTANLERVNLASTGALEPVEGTEATLQPLVSSSAESMLMDVSRARGMPEPDDLLRDFAPDEEVYTLIARLTGPTKSAYPDGPPAPEADGGQAPETDASANEFDTSPNGQGDDGEEDDTPHIAQAREDIAVVVGADSDLFEDRFWVQQQNVFGQRTSVPIADNATLIVNALENLAGADALMGLRGRGVTERPFEVVQRIRREAEARYLEQEKRLEDELAATEQRLQELQSQMGQGEQLVTPEQEAEIERFRERTLEIREQLREVQRNLVEDIEALETTLAFINIALVPILLTILALAVAWWRRRRRSQRWSR